MSIVNEALKKKQREDAGLPGQNKKDSGKKSQDSLVSPEYCLMVCTIMTLSVIDLAHL